MYERSSGTKSESAPNPNAQGAPRAIAALAISVASFALLVAPATAQLALPSSGTFAIPSSGTTEATFTLDMSTLPLRPEFIIEVTPDAAHADMVLEIETANFFYTPTGSSAGPNNCSPSFPDFPVGISGTGPGPNSFRREVWRCEPRIERYVDYELDVTIRVISIGSGGYPANVGYVFRGETQVPTGELFVEVDPTPSTQTVTLPILRDTTLYEATPDFSNGAGDHLWSGKNEFLTTNPPGTSRNDIRAALAFDMAGLPTNAVVHYAELQITANGVIGVGGDVSLYRIAPDTIDPTMGWPEGDGNGFGDEFFGGSSSIPAATWNERSSGSIDWGVDGGDLLALGGGSAIATRTISSTGLHTFNDSALSAVVADMLADGERNDGFLLRGPFNFFTVGDEGVRFNSSEHPSGPAPALFLEFTPIGAFNSAELEPDTVPFVNEGENLRWIYDLDADNVLQTTIGGICTAVDPSAPAVTLPYTYEWTGATSYTGLDCCSWQLESSVTGTLGTGQAIFFHNLDPMNAANIPPDTDGDGMRDLCDNCIYTPNGPSLGTCVGGTANMNTCRRNGECPGGTCSLSQEDDDQDFVGNACPEPGFASMLSIGLLGCSSLARSRRRPLTPHGASPL